MGSTIWVEIHGRRLEETGEDLSKMLRVIESLDDLAVGLGVQGLSRYLDYTEMAREAEEVLGPPGNKEAEDEAGRAEPATETVAQRQAVGEWFDAGEALTALRALRGHLEEHPAAVKVGVPDWDEGRYRSELMEELRTCERLVGEAAAEGRRFRLLIVP